jgi:hypothetical protein
VFLWLRAREQKRADKGEPVLAAWRLAFAAFFGLVALFSGGCSLLFLAETTNGNHYVDLPAVLIIGGIPFAAAVLLTWLFLRRGAASSGADPGN